MTSPSLNKELVALALKCGAFQNEGGHGIPAGTLITFEADELADFVAALPSALPVEGAGPVSPAPEALPRTCQSANYDEACQFRNVCVGCATSAAPMEKK